MDKGGGTFQACLVRVRESSVTETRELFRRWVDPPEKAGRVRLFSPLKSLLAVPGSGALRGRLLPRDGSQVPGLAGCRKGGNRICKHGRVLPGPGKAILEGNRALLPANRPENRARGPRAGLELVVWAEGTSGRRLWGLDARHA